MDILFLETGVKVFLGCKEINPVEHTGNPRKIVIKETTTPRAITIFAYADGNSSPNLDIFDVILSTHTSPPCEIVSLNVQNPNKENLTKYFIFHRQFLLQNPLKNHVHVLQDFLA